MEQVAGWQSPACCPAQCQSSLESCLETRISAVGVLALSVWTATSTAVAVRVQVEAVLPYVQVESDPGGKDRSRHRMPCIRVVVVSLMQHQWC